MSAVAQAKQEDRAAKRSREARLQQARQDAARHTQSAVICLEAELWSEASAHFRLAAKALDVLAGVKP